MTDDVTRIRIIPPDANVIFEDGFEDDPSDWVCTDGSLINWTAGYGNCGVSGTYGPEWKMGPGRNGGNAVYAWKHSSVPNGYRSDAKKWLYGSDLHQEVYHRWYMKWDPAADKYAAEGFKLWRYITRENGYVGSPEVYLSVNADPLVSDGHLYVVHTPVEGGFTKNLCLMSEIMDDTWHCCEFRLKLNDSGSSNAELQFWLDGTLKATHTGLSFGDIPDMKVHRFGVGIGNVSDTAWLNDTWAAIAFDDVVLSTAYIGLAP